MQVYAALATSVDPGWHDRAMKHDRAMETEVQALRDALARTELIAHTTQTDRLAMLQQSIEDQLDDYILPRYRRLDAPLLAVVGGSTGAGKSTLVNALVQAKVTVPGALRPTTRDPVLIHHPDDADWFTQPRILPGLARVHSVATANRSAEQVPAVLRLVEHTGIGPGLGLLDAPDIDSVVAGNRALAAQLLAAADLWIFVTTANRYADAVPWSFLREASIREVVVAMVLDRVPVAVRDDVADDLHQMLVQQGLQAAPLFVLTEQQLDAEAMLDPDSVADLRGWVQHLTTDASTRTEVMRQTLAGATQRVAEQSRELAAGMQELDRSIARLVGGVEHAYATADIDQALGDGSLLRGEVLARWQDFIGTGEFFRNLETRIGQIRDRLTAVVRGRPRAYTRVEEAIGDGLHALLIAQADESARQAQQVMMADPDGRALLDERDWSRARPDFADRANAMIRGWQHFILELVRQEGQGRRTGARILAFSVNGVGVVLMIAAFSITGGLAGAEIAIAGGTAVVAQRLLEAIFGEEGVRRLAKSARDELRERVDELMVSERQRFLDLLAPPLSTTDELRRCVAAILDKNPESGAQQ